MAKKIGNKNNKIVESQKSRKFTDWHEFMARPRPSSRWFAFMRTPRFEQNPFMTPNEAQILSFVRDHGGEMPISDIARKLGYATNYTKMICEGLGRKDIIDVFSSGVCRIPEDMDY
ncbi:MAG: MarR family transcriptional regulator [Proteobacteria bacterium]|nr:MarR family transcriptional regulator [Pseudomonadota bacterium]